MKKNKNVTNKSIAGLLTNYFKKQDPSTVAHLCASMIIDINRFMNIDDLSPRERESLMERSKENIKIVDICESMIDGIKSFTNIDDSSLEVIIKNS